MVEPKKIQKYKLITKINKFVAYLIITMIQGIIIINHSLTNRNQQQLHTYILTAERAIYTTTNKQTCVHI